MRTGTVNLPLHGGKAPRWLFERMVKLACGISEVVVYEYGQKEFLRRISDPYWFQAFSCVLGFDWHSSGTTTTTCGALKAALKPEEHGIAVAGGKDNLYHHCFFLTEDGDWAIVQQGMNNDYARRYQWLSDSLSCFIEPHEICCDRKEADVLDMTAHESEPARRISLDLVKDNPAHHPVLDIDIGERGMEVLKRAYELQPRNYEELISLEGMGPKKIRALALISDLIYGSKPSWNDPVKYSFTHGDKDGFPYPVDREVYDNSIRLLHDSLEGAKIDRKEKYLAIKRLGEFIGKNSETQDEDAWINSL